MVNKKIISLLGLLTAIIVMGLLLAGKRDEFPGRRQGGGSRGFVPSQITSPEVCVTAGCEPQTQD